MHTLALVLALGATPAPSGTDAEATTAALAAAPGSAASAGVPDEWGDRGAFLGLTVVGMSGVATDEDGASGGALFGMGYRFRFGEEALDGLTLGMEILGGGGEASEYEAGFGGFVMQAGWRPHSKLDGLVLLFGTGFGGGGVTSKSEGFEDSSIAGSLHQLGAMYEFRLGEHQDGYGFVIAPLLDALFVPTSGTSEAYIFVGTVGVSGAVYLGR